MSIIRSAVSRAVGVAVSGVCLLQPRTVPKTTSGRCSTITCNAITPSWFLSSSLKPYTLSGKIARQWCRKAYLNKELKVAPPHIHMSGGGEGVGGNFQCTVDCVTPSEVVMCVCRWWASGSTSVKRESPVPLGKPLESRLNHRRRTRSLKRCVAFLAGALLTCSTPLVIGRRSE